MKIISFHDLPEDAFVIDDVRDNVDKSLFDKNLNKLLDTLLPREVKVLKLRFWQGLTLEQCASHMHLSRERIRQIEAKAIRKLRHPSRQIEIRKFLPSEFGYLDDAEAYQRQLEIDAVKRRQEELEYERLSKIRYETYHAERKQKILEARKKDKEYVESFKRHIEVQSVIPKTSQKFPTQYVTLGRDDSGFFYLRLTERATNLGFTISRARDPETYDRWLEQAIGYFNTNSQVI